jgi:parallel beta-helix repeat protein
MDKNPLLKKGFTIGIVLLFVGTCIIPSTAQNFEKPLPTSRGNWLYVGGSGPNNYTSIQDAIDASSNGDTVFVYDESSPYYGELIVNKSIYLFGENRNTTIIDGLLFGNSMEITADNVTLSGFTIRDGGFYVTRPWNMSGIKVTGHNTIISDNIITQNAHGISFYKTDHGNITRNIITGNNGSGIYIWGSKNISIYRNVITKNINGIMIGWIFDHSFYIKIIENDIDNIHDGLVIIAKHNQILRNNFRNNSINAVFLGFPNKWDGNYWNQPRHLPKPIFGTIGLLPIIPWIEFDWHPAQEPYVIP